MTSHDEAFERLSELLEGELSTAEAEGVEAHVAGCARCASRLETLRATLEGLHALPPVRAPDDLARRVRRRVRRRPEPRSGAWLQEMAIAAVLAMVVGTGVLVGERVLVPEVAEIQGPEVLAFGGGGAEGAAAARRRVLVLRYAPADRPAVEAFLAAAADAGAVDASGRPLAPGRRVPETGLVLLIREPSLSLASALLAESGVSLEPAPEAAPTLEGRAARLPAAWAAVRLVARERP